MNDEELSLLTRDAAGSTFQRSATLTREAINVEARTVELCLSSEEPYDRWWGREVLSHDRTAIRLGRLASGRHPLLVDHSTRDQVGVIERVWIGDDRRLRCIARFGKSARAEEIFQDVIDGIRSLVSIGYQIHEMKLSKESDSGDEYLVTDWEPHEGSIVAVPADATVGVGRDDDSDRLIRSLIDRAKTPPKTVTTPKERTMDDDEVKIEEKKAAAEAKRVSESATAQERQRMREITALGEKFGKRKEAAEAVEAGASYDTFRESVFTTLEKSGALKLAEPGEIGLSRKEVQQFRFTNLILATLYPGDEAVRKTCGFEMECARAAADKREDVRADRAGAFTIPVDVLTSPLDMRAGDAEQVTRMLMQRMMSSGRVGQRDLVVGTPTAGGNLVATELLASSFIDILVNQLSVMQMGATMLSDLQGNIAIPRATAGSTGYWVAENAGPTESQQTFDQVALTPKTAGAYVDYGRRLLLQASIAVEAFVRMDIARTMALLIDLAALAGTGASNQPRGVLNTSGIGSVAGGTNGLAPIWDHIVALESAVANANAPAGSLGYLTNTKVRGKLKTTQKFSGTNGQEIWQGGELNGAPARVSNQVPSNLTKGTSSGVCSAIVYGNWSDLLIALWGGLDLMLDPYAGSLAGTRRVIALQDVDVNVRYPVSFASMQDALTT
ncbi:phage major capsid protein [Methylibium sp.]|uniref:phage major capsid protein n=1 Tax=Methylibium sp. TaxID=2067992 RepID=UPI003D134CC8